MRKAILVMAVLLLQVLDVLTTRAGLAAGLREGNPVMAWAQAELGDQWWALKIAVAGLAVLALLLVRSPWPLAGMAAFYVWLVASNWWVT